MSRAIILVLLIAIAAPAWAQTTDPVVRTLLTDLGWHGVGGDVQVNRPTMEARLPWVSVWERAPRSERYGDWMYVQVMIDCSQWKQIPFATLDEDFNYTRMEDITGEFPAAMWTEPGTEPWRTMTAVCGLFGYVRPQQLRLPAAPDGTPHVGGIERVR